MEVFILYEIRIILDINPYVQLFILLIRIWITKKRVFKYIHFSFYHIRNGCVDTDIHIRF